MLTEPAWPPQPRPPSGLHRAPYTQPSPCELWLASQAPRTETQPATAAAVGGTSAFPAAAAAILAHPAPGAAAADVSEGDVNAPRPLIAPPLASSSLSLLHPLPRSTAPPSRRRSVRVFGASCHAPWSSAPLSRPVLHRFIILSRPLGGAPLKSNEETGDVAQLKELPPRNETLAL